MEEHKEGLGVFSSNTIFEVGDGSKYYGMTCSVGIRPLQKLFQIYIVLHALRMPV
jgi:hypothetical protein